MDKARYSFKGWKFSEYADYIFSVGSVFTVFLITLGFTIAATVKHISIPQQLYSIPIGFGLFFFAYLFDSLAHHSIWKNSIDAHELTVHIYMTTFSGYPLFVSFILSYWWPALMMPFIGGFLFLKSMYSLIDEVMCHQTRLKTGKSDMIEATAHCFQFLGNVLYDIGFIYLIYWNHWVVIKALFN